MSILEDLAANVISGNAPKTEELTKQALDDGMTPSDVLNNGLVAGMEVVGVKFKANEFYVPEVLIAARAMKAGMTILRPKLAETGVEPAGRFAIGTVKGDLHDIGKNLVSMMVEGAGYEVIDLGVDVSPEKFSATITENNVDVIGLSALLTTTMTNMKAVVDKVNEDGLRDKVKIVIGGAPLTQNFADEIGADGFAQDAASAVDLVKSMIN
jgi:5-methyltetrahydrofolate--homocysteine methyltransferase